MWRCWASLSKIPGSMLLMVTLRAAVCRARPAAKLTSPARAPFDRPSSVCGTFTLRETMLTMRPKPRAIMPSTVSRIISIGPSIMSSSAAIQSSRDQSRKSPGSGPCELLIRISGCGQACDGGGAAGRRGEVAGNGRDLDAGCLRNLGAGAFERVAGAGNNGQIDAFARQRKSAGFAEPAARAAHQRGLALDAEVQVPRRACGVQAATADSGLSL